MRVTNEQEKFKNVQNYYSGWNDRYSNYTEQHQKKYEKSEAHGIIQIVRNMIHKSMTYKNKGSINKMK